MKKLKLFLSAVVLLINYNVVKAAGNDEGMLTKTHAINTYVNAITLGKLDGLAEVIDPSAKFNMMQGNHVGSYGKKQMLDFLSSVRNVEQNCTTSTSIVESNANITIVRVDMQFSNFVCNNYVTIVNTGKGWKIINVYSIFN